MVSLFVDFFQYFFQFLLTNLLVLGKKREERLDAALEQTVTRLVHEIVEILLTRKQRNLNIGLALLLEA